MGPHFIVSASSSPYLQDQAVCGDEQTHLGAAPAQNLWLIMHTLRHVITLQVCITGPKICGWASFIYISNQGQIRKKEAILLCCLQ